MLGTGSAVSAVLDEKPRQNALRIVSVFPGCQMLG
jgi:hypothetical protein